MKRKLHKTINGIEYKHCSRCDKWLSLSGFHKTKGNWDNLAWHCKFCYSKNGKKYRKNNPDKRKETTQNWYKKYGKEYYQNYYKSNRGRIRKIQWKSERKRYYSNPLFRLKRLMGNGIRQSIKKQKNGHSWETFVGYTKNDLVKHLEKQFKKGMTWDNYGEWEIDHIIPISAFNITNIDCLDFRQCWSLKNLKPIWRTENIIKRNKLLKDFQPSLGF